MSWYYLNESGEVVGPVSEQALKELNVAGSLTEASLVCREGTEDWIGLAEALGTRPSPSVGGESFKFNCPHCDQQIAAEPAQIGVSLQCPACGGGTVVPSTGEAVARPQETPLLDAPRVGDSQYGDSKKPDHQPESSEPAESASSFADRLQTGATAGWSAVKRHSNQAALIAQIEKLRNVDLRMAHYELGKKCFESGILESELEEEFQAVRELDAKIAEKREKLETEADETRIDALKRIGKGAAKVSHAQALTLKRQHLLTHLGRSAFSRRENEDLSGLEAEIAAIEEIERNIRSKEEEEALIPGAGNAKGWRNRTPAIAVAAALGLLLILGTIVASSVVNRHNEKRSAELIKQADAHAFATAGTPDWQQTVVLLIEASDLGSHEAEYKLGSCYLFGRGVSQDLGEATNLFMRSAAGGFAEAQFNLSVCYAKGTGVEQSEQEMLKWLKLAAVQKFPQAMHSLGSFYLSGQAVPQDKTKGIELITGAANQGLTQAQYELSLCFELGNGVQKDMVQSYKWAILAANSGLSGGDEAVRELQSKLSDEQVEAAERLARDWKP